jgi:hypothetical protein
MRGDLISCSSPSRIAGMASQPGLAFQKDVVAASDADQLADPGERVP